MQISSSCIDLIISHILCKYHLIISISCRLLKKVQETKQHENEYLLNYFDTVISCVYMNLEQLIFIYTSVEYISNFCSNRAWFTESNNNVFSNCKHNFPMIYKKINIESYLSVLECGGW